MFQPGDIVRWSKAAKEDIAEYNLPAGPFVVLGGPGKSVSMAEIGKTQRVASGPGNHLGYWNPRYLELDPFLTAVHQRKHKLPKEEVK